ncbi:MAG: symbB, partial [Myxococcaceae bacterium]|nr:symbB [Myxococcaceae bacterium]
MLPLVQTRVALCAGSSSLYLRIVRRLGLFALLWSAACGRVGVDLMAIDNLCVDGTCAGDVDRCLGDPNKAGPGICGCDVSDSADADGDGTPDCDDLCPGVRDRLSGAKCGCDAASADSDGDGSANCQDSCPHDFDKKEPLMCGCGVPDVDTDGDGMADCTDACPNDPTKVVAGSCGCGVPESKRDVDHDGKLDCVDLCNGIDDARYVPDHSCGVGYCQTDNTPSSCSSAVETECKPGAPLGSSDALCDGVDDDCDGKVDEDFPSSSTSCGVGACAAAGAIVCIGGVQTNTCAPGKAAANDMTCGGDDDCDGMLDEDFKPFTSTCGSGVCMSSGTVTCSSGVSHDSCAPTAPTMSMDTTCNGLDEDCSGTADEDYVTVVSSCGFGVCKQAGAVSCAAGKTRDSCVVGRPTSDHDGPPANGLDDDCDGLVDEDSCLAPPTTYAVGAYANIAVPVGCGSATVQLWGGGGGAGGQTSVGSTGTPGSGGAGGYSSQKVVLSGAFTLYVGAGGQGCGAGGPNAGAATYAGGNGAPQGGNGAPGADGVVAGGGAGATAGAGNGAKGYYGGGGGGSGVLAPWPPYPGLGGGGGAASVVLVGGTPAVVAGGGGGGGG